MSTFRSISGLLLLIIAVSHTPSSSFARISILSSERRRPGASGTAEAHTLLPQEPKQHDIAFTRHAWFKRNFAITYYNKGMKDGAGAQGLRLLGIYAIAKAYGLNYVHTPVASVAHTEDEGWTRKWQAFLHLPSDAINTTGFRRTYAQPMGFLKFESLQQAMVTAKQQNTPTLLYVLYPYAGNFSFQQPRMVAALSDLRSQVPHRALDAGILRTVRVAVHLRRGDVAWDGRKRTMPVSYYTGAASAVAQELEALGRSYVIEVFTELGWGCAKPGSRPHQLMTTTPTNGTNSKASNGKAKAAHYLMDASCPQLLSQKLIKQENRFLNELHKLPNMLLFADSEPLWSMQQIRTADILVISKSSYSVLPALLASPSSIVLRPGHVPNGDSHFGQYYTSWFVAEDDTTGKLPADMVAAIRKQHGTSLDTDSNRMKQQPAAVAVKIT